MAENDLELANLQPSCQNNPPIEQAKMKNKQDGLPQDSQNKASFESTVKSEVSINATNKSIQTLNNSIGSSNECICSSIDATPNRNI